jgi:short-subunit dehydrogenase
MPPTAIITGASQGIGRATAFLFAKQGYDLVLAARSRENLEAIATEIRSLGRDALVIPTDTRDAGQVREMIDRSLEHFGAIDVLINNAGVYLLGSVEDCTLEDWHTIIDTNLWGYIHTIHALLPHFLARGKGTIVNVGSIGGQIPIAYQAPYITSKYAVTGLTEALEAELSPKGITVCGVHPNLIKSSLMERAIFRGKDEKDAADRRELLQKALDTDLVEKPTDVARAIWEAVSRKQTEVLVGTANLAKTSYQLFPGALQWVFRKTFSTRAS